MLKIRYKYFPKDLIEITNDFVCESIVGIFRDKELENNIEEEIFTAYNYVEDLQKIALEVLCHFCSPL